MFIIYGKEKKSKMIILKDLKNRVYEGKECVYFEYIIELNKNSKVAARFSKQKHCGSRFNEWKMQVVTDRTRDKDSEVYNFGYVMPRENLPLELIAATGLKYFQLYLKEEIQEKSNMDFTIGEIIRGM